jgi:hypothetical protein
MLDVHVLTSGGATSLTNVGTIPSNDGAVTAGIPVSAGAQLIGYGALDTIADTIKEVKFTAPGDIFNNENGLDDVTGGTASGIIHYWANIPYSVGQRQIAVASNTGAANTMVYTIDLYPGGPVGGPSPWIGPGRVASSGFPNSSNYGTYSTVFSGALTAITYGTVSLGPTNPLPTGKYQILGAKVSSLTNYAIIRFLHNDFGPLAPGFPVVDPNVTIARANTPLDPLFTVAQGHQFTYLSQLLGGPVEPYFTVQPGATGLRFQVIAITADTPQVTVNLVKVA